MEQKTNTKNHHIYLYLLECKREAKELIDGEKQEMKKGEKICSFV